MVTSVKGTTPRSVGRVMVVARWVDSTKRNLRTLSQGHYLQWMAARVTRHRAGLATSYAVCFLLLAVRPREASVVTDAYPVEPNPGSGGESLIPFRDDWVPTHQKAWRAACSSLMILKKRSSFVISKTSKI